jgi:hypothetical protein
MIVLYSVLGLFLSLMAIHTLAIASLPFVFWDSYGGSFWDHTKFCARIWIRMVIDLILTMFVPIIVPLGLICMWPKLNRLVDRNLPLMFWWYDNYKDPLGDVYWQGPEHANGNQKDFIWRLRWLLRNSLNNWGYAVLGWDNKGQNGPYSYVSGDTDTSDQPVGHSGKLFIKGTNDNQPIYPCYYVVRQYFNLPICLRMYYGWKLKGGLKPSDFPIQFVASLSPIKSFKKV